MASERIEDSGQSRAGALAHREPSTVAEQRSARQQAQTPEALVAQIQATREDLAETLDAIADRVSPKRVAKRSADRMKELAASAKVVASEKAAVARVVVGEKAAIAKETLSEQAATAKETLSEKTATAKVTVSEKTAGAKSAVAAHTGSAAPAAVLDSEPAAASSTGVRPPARGAGPGGLPPRLAPATSRVTEIAASLPKEAIAGAVAALVALWLLSRHRRS